MIITESVRKCNLFSGLSDTEIKNAFQLLHMHVRQYAKNTVIKQTDDLLPAFGMVESGAVTVYMNDFDGNCLVMSRASASDTFGESLCFLQKRTPFYIVATEQTTIYWFSCDFLRDHFESDNSIALRNRFIASLAARTLAMNDRIQVLSKFTIREKLITYFTQCRNDADSNTFTLTLDRAALASHLGTERSALSRELSKMQKEGILKAEKNKITLIHLPK